MKYLSVFLLTAFVSLALLELSLNLFDPLGIRLYFYGQTRQSWAMVEDVTGYRILEGDYYFSAQTRILADGSRDVPASHNDSDCSLVLLGDSVTFGWGVTDSETFANLIALDHATQVKNVARSGYNAGNIEALYQTYPANAYLWLMIPNDINETWAIDWSHRQSSYYLPATWLYFQYLFPSVNGYHLREDKPTYERVVNRLSQDNRVLLIAFEDDSNAPQSVIRIPEYTQFVSAYDHHPSALGHAQLYQEMKPYIDELIERICR